MSRRRGSCCPRCCPGIAPAPQSIHSRKFFALRASRANLGSDRRGVGNDLARTRFARRWPLDASRDAASPERVLTPCNERIKSAYSMDARRVARCQPGLGLPGDAAARRARGASTTRIQCRYVGLLSSGPRSAPAVGSFKLQSVGRLDSRCSRCAPPAAPTVASSPVNLSETAIWSTRQLAVILLTGLGFIWWSPRYRGIQVAGPAPAHLIAARASG